MLKINEYMVVENNDLSDFEKEIDNMICKDWIPQGGINVYKDEENNEPIYHQAMIKYK